MTEPMTTGPAATGWQAGIVHPGVEVRALTINGARISSPGKRLGAYLLDGVLAIVTVLIGWLIWSLIVWTRGQSPGKQLLGMRVVRTDTGLAAGFGKMALRELVGKSVLAFVTFGITNIVSCFMILGERRQGVWDKLATTVVADDPDGRLVRR